MEASDGEESLRGMTNERTQGTELDPVREMGHVMVWGMLYRWMRGMAHGSMRGTAQSSMCGMAQGSVRGMEQGSVRGMEQGSMHGMEQGSMRGMEQGSMRGFVQGTVHEVREKLQELVVGSHGEVVHEAQVEH
jgi:hypothetical protein